MLISMPTFALGKSIASSPILDRRTVLNLPSLNISNTKFLSSMSVSPESKGILRFSAKNLITLILSQKTII